MRKFSLPHENFREILWRLKSKLNFSSSARNNSAWKFYASDGHDRLGEDLLPLQLNKRKTSSRSQIDLRSDGVQLYECKIRLELIFNAQRKGMRKINPKNRLVNHLERSRESNRKKGSGKYLVARLAPHFKAPQHLAEHFSCLKSENMENSSRYLLPAVPQQMEIPFERETSVGISRARELTRLTLGCYAAAPRQISFVANENDSLLCDVLARPKRLQDTFGHWKRAPVGRWINNEESMWVVRRDTVLRLTTKKKGREKQIVMNCPAKASSLGRQTTHRHLRERMIDEGHLGLIAT